MQHLPDRIELRRFGFVACVVFGALAFVAYREVFVFSFGLGVLRMWLAALFSVYSVYALGASLLQPKANLSLYMGLRAISYPIRWLVTALILSVMFYLVITPIALVLRLLGRDPLERKFEREAASYWRKRGEARDKRDYFRQF